MSLSIYILKCINLSNGRFKELNLLNISMHQTLYKFIEIAAILKVFLFIC